MRKKSTVVLASGRKAVLGLGMANEKDNTLRFDLDEWRANAIKANAAEHGALIRTERGWLVLYDGNGRMIPRERIRLDADGEPGF